MTRGALVTAALTLLLGSSADDLRVSLRNTAASYLANIAKIGTIAGRDTTYDYYERLNDDADLLADPSVPQGYTAEQWSEVVRRVASLDLSLATQLLQGSYESMASVRGVGETFVRSSSDATMQPVAVYVPSTYVPGRPGPLIVLLHGHPQSETELLAPPYIARLAEQTGTIVVAPWGRGYYDFRGSIADVYDALHAAERAFSIDPRRRFLAGYSMGGFSVFEVAPAHADEWSAVMCIAGALLGSDAQRLVALMRNKPFYVLTGSADNSIPTQYPTVTAAFLQSAGIDVSFYSEPGGIHRLVTLLPILTLAWNDMLHQIVRSPPPASGNVTLPSSIPMSALKP
ncbi:MAG TPA: alpha/beta fold hydrolase [Candidatus Cybelea sp.]|jgi:acetyl esterase/lipase|nr:alpha/beta fold hydrolase [Candidatus Cybelea sp.]